MSPAQISSSVAKAPALVMGSCSMSAAKDTVSWLRAFRAARMFTLELADVRSATACSRSLRTDHLPCSASRSSRPCRGRARRSTASRWLTLRCWLSKMNGKLRPKRQAVVHRCKNVRLTWPPSAFERSRKLHSSRCAKIARPTSNLRAIVSREPEGAPGSKNLSTACNALLVIGPSYRKGPLRSLNELALIDRAAAVPNRDTFQA